MRFDWNKIYRGDIQTNDYLQYKMQRKREIEELRYVIPTAIVAILCLGVIFGVGYIIRPYMPDRIISIPMSSLTARPFEMKVNVSYILAFPLAGFMVGTVGVLVKGILRDTVVSNPETAILAIILTGVIAFCIHFTVDTGNVIGSIVISLFMMGWWYGGGLLFGLALPAVAGFVFMEFIISTSLDNRKSDSYAHRILGLVLFGLQLCLFVVTGVLIFIVLVKVLKYFLGAVVAITLLCLFFCLLHHFCGTISQMRKKKQEQLVRSLSEGDRVRTIAGTIGTIVYIQDDTIRLRLEDADLKEVLISSSAIYKKLRKKS